MKQTTDSSEVRGFSVTFIDTLRSEWTKIRSLRSTAYTLLSLVVIGVGFSGLISNGAGNDYAGLSAAEKAVFDPTATSLRPFLIVQLVISVLGILIITSEHATGMLQNSLAASPRRSRLLAAKAVVFTVIALVVAQAEVFGAFFVGQAVLAGTGAPSVSLADPGVLAAVLGGGLYLAAIGLLAVAVGTLVRATAGAITIMVSITLLVPALSSVFPEWMQNALLIWPSLGGGQVMTVVPDPAFPMPWVNFGGMCAAIAVVLAVAFAVFRRRDV